jgi:glucokinase
MRRSQVSFGPREPQADRKQIPSFSPRIRVAHCLNRKGDALMAKKILVGVDLGGTSLLAVATTAKGKILGRKKRKTRAEEGASAVLDRIVRTVEDAVGEADAKLSHVRAMGIGAPGPLNPKTGVILHAPNLGPTWNKLPIVDHLSERLGCPVYLGNDVDMGAVGEHALGAGKGYSQVVAIFVGTGIGGGLILNDRLYRGVRYTAGELGHVVLLADGPLCGCGKHGCAEALASRTAMEREIRARIAAGQSSLVPELLEREGRSMMSSSVIEAALDGGDSVVQEVMAQAEYYMGLLVANVVNTLDPEVVVLGGGVVERLGERYLEPVRETAEQYYLNQQDKEKIHVVATELGEYAGVLGAAMMAKRAWKRERKKKKK